MLHLRLFYRKKKLFSVLENELAFDFTSEMSLYLLSDEFKMLNAAPRFPRQPNQPGHSNVSSTLSVAVSSSSTPVAQQWCLAHASHVLGVTSAPCKKGINGGVCDRVHPTLSTPLTDPQKAKLKPMANFIRSSVQKSKFLSAVA